MRAELRAIELADPHRFERGALAAGTGRDVLYDALARRWEALGDRRLALALATGSVGRHSPAGIVLCRQHVAEMAAEVGDLVVQARSMAAKGVVHRALAVLPAHGHETQAMSVVEMNRNPYVSDGTLIDRADELMEIARGEWVAPRGPVRAVARPREVMAAFEALKELRTQCDVARMGAAGRGVVVAWVPAITQVPLHVSDSTVSDAEVLAAIAAATELLQLYWAEVERQVWLQLEQHRVEQETVADLRSSRQVVRR